jgi:hypothetical protein
MSTRAEIHVGDTVDFKRRIVDQDSNVVDISSATTMRMIFRKPKPNQEKVTLDASFINGGADGWLHVKCNETFLDAPGVWRRAEFVVTPSGQWQTNEIEFTVHPKI